MFWKKRLKLINIYNELYLSMKNKNLKSSAHLKRITEHEKDTTLQCTSKMVKLIEESIESKYKDTWGWRQKLIQDSENNKRGNAKVVDPSYLSNNENRECSFTVNIGMLMNRYEILKKAVWTTEGATRNRLEGGRLDDAKFEA